MILPRETPALTARLLFYQYNTASRLTRWITGRFLTFSAVGGCWTALAVDDAHAAWLVPGYAGQTPRYFGYTTDYLRGCTVAFGPVFDADNRTFTDSHLTFPWFTACGLPTVTQIPTWFWLVATWFTVNIRS